MPSNYDSRRILRNTLTLYARMLITVWLNLWATRLTLQHLGVNDLGVFGVVGSVVSMFGVFTSGITKAVERFITFELGRGREERVNEVFCTSLNVLLLLGLILALMLEAVGPWLLQTQVRIPAESAEAARWVFHFTVAAFVIELLAIPYNALVTAYERMQAFALFSILKVVLTCAAAWMLSLWAQDERLVVYGAAMAATSLLVRLGYQCYCRWQFPVARYRWHIDAEGIRQLSRFAGISTLSSIFQLVGNQGITFVINWTFGVSLNAVYAIALQLKNMVLSFALNLFKAIQPQITKTYAEGNYEMHSRLVYNGSRLEVYLIYFLMLPFLCRTQQVMELWLGDVPPFTVAFVRGIIFISLTYAAFEPIRTAVLATGRIGRFMLIPEAFYLLVLPVGYLVARQTGSPQAMLCSIVLMDVFTCCLRVWLGAQVSVLRVTHILRRIVVPALCVAVLDAALCILLSHLLPKDLAGLILLVLLNSAALAAMIYPQLKTLRK